MSSLVNSKQMLSHIYEDQLRAYRDHHCILCSLAPQKIYARHLFAIDKHIKLSYNDCNMNSAKISGF